MNQVTFRDIDRIFDLWAPTERAWQPNYDVDENAEQYLMTVDLPGVPRDQIKIETIGNRITVSGSRSGYGKFQRGFSVPPHVDTGKIEARYQDGVLSIQVPKPEVVKPRQIAIN